ncbi:hypothetical protein F4679DRAFT_545199 [Xylaria curta]|nr:hypothetical protein F4679DRAFT_545199 [Xylaria curta]
MNAKLFEEDIATAHRHLKNLISCIKPRDPSSTTSHDHYDKFRERFEQMSGEYDDLSGSCRVNIGKAILNAETHATVISKHAAEASVVLAFVAMIYLPMSAVASIFAMPILDFKADWKDMNGRPVPTETHSSGDAQPVVVSYYMAHYLGVSLALLLLTLEGWYISTRENVNGSNSGSPS